MLSPEETRKASRQSRSNLANNQANEGIILLLYLSLLLKQREQLRLLQHPSPSPCRYFIRLGTPKLTGTNQVRETPREIDEFGPLKVPHI